MHLLIVNSIKSQHDYGSPSSPYPFLRIHNPILTSVSPQVID